MKKKKSMNGMLEKFLLIIGWEKNSIFLINKENNLSNAIYWLNKGIEEINVDLNKCVLYLNIALEYCANGEKGESFFVQQEEAGEIFKNISNYIEENYSHNEVANEEQFDTYNKIRDARNDIIHGRKKVEIQKHDIINCYMFLSKVMFYKLKEN